MFKQIAIMMRTASAVAAATLTITAGGAFTSTAAFADSCWNHNGSLMRIIPGGGGRRTIVYERPRQVLRNAGVRSGTVLFTGRYNGSRYNGTARRFSKFCVGSPQTYGVAGPANNSRIVLRGSRDKNRRCQNTGRIVRDRLVFTFSHAC